MYPLESWDEANVDEALDMLTENMPGFFASEKDGKLYGYDFEIIENNNDNIIKNGQKENTSKYRLKNWLIDRCIAFHRDAFHHDEKTLDEMKVDLEKRDLEDVMYYYDFLVGSIERALYEYADEKIYEKCID